MLAKNEYYLGNQLLKRTNVQVNLTKEQAEEYLRCAEDPVYFIKNYVYIINVDHGKMKFDLWPFQERMVKHFIENRFPIFKLPRQVGKTTTVAALICWLVLFHMDYKVIILANKGTQSREIMSRVQMAYENVPVWMQQGVKEWNKKSFVLENGSKVKAEATSGSGVRGDSFNFIYMDELAHVDNFIQEEFFASVYPTISSGKTTKLCVTSTPLGLNMFYKLWTEAEKGKNKFKPFSIHWSDVPGRDAEWEATERANMTEEKFRQEYECEFIGSSRTLINSKTLQRLVMHNPIETSGHIKVYKMPEKGHNYVTCVDTSRGVNEDYSAFTVVDVSQIPYEVVCTYRDNTINPMFYPNIIEEVSKRYNESYILVETNDVGLQVATMLHQELEYGNMFMTAMRGRAGQVLSGGHVPGGGVGVRTSKQVKRIGCANLKTIIEGDKIVLNDADLFEELKRFVQIGDSYQAEPGWHDDLTMSLVIFSWVITQDLFKDLTDTNMRLRIQGEAQSALDDSIVVAFGIEDHNVPVDEVKTVSMSAFDRWFYEE